MAFCFLEKQVTVHHTMDHSVDSASSKINARIPDSKLLSTTRSAKTAERFLRNDTVQVKADQVKSSLPGEANTSGRFGRLDATNGAALVNKMESKLRDNVTNLEQKCTNRNGMISDSVMGNATTPGDFFTDSTNKEKESKNRKLTTTVRSCEIPTESAMKVSSEVVAVSKENKLQMHPLISKLQNTLGQQSQKPHNTMEQHSQESHNTLGQEPEKIQSTLLQNSHISTLAESSKVNVIKDMRPCVATKVAKLDSFEDSLQLDTQTVQLLVGAELSPSVAGKLIIDGNEPHVSSSRCQKEKMESNINTTQDSIVELSRKLPKHPSSLNLEVKCNQRFEIPNDELQTFSSSIISESFDMILAELNNNLDSKLIDSTTSDSGGDIEINCSSEDITIEDDAAERYLVAEIASSKQEPQPNFPNAAAEYDSFSSLNLDASLYTKSSPVSKLDSKLENVNCRQAGAHVHAADNVNEAESETLFSDSFQMCHSKEFLTGSDSEALFNDSVQLHASFTDTCPHDREFYSEKQGTPVITDSELHHLGAALDETFGDVSTKSEEIISGSSLSQQEKSFGQTRDSLTVSIINRVMQYSFTSDNETVIEKVSANENSKQRTIASNIDNTADSLNLSAGTLNSPRKEVATDAATVTSVGHKSKRKSSPATNLSPPRKLNTSPHENVNSSRGETDDSDIVQPTPPKSNNSSLRAGMGSTLKSQNNFSLKVPTSKRAKNMKSLLPWATEGPTTRISRRSMKMSLLNDKQVKGTSCGSGNTSATVDSKKDESMKQDRDRLECPDAMSTTHQTVQQKISVLCKDKQRFCRLSDYAANDKNLANDRLAVFDVTSDKELFRTFIAEWKSKPVFSISIACEKWQTAESIGFGISRRGKSLNNYKLIISTLYVHLSGSC